MQKPNNSKGPGLAGTVALIGGMLSFFWLSSHPASLPVVLLTRLLASGTGQHLPPFAGIAAGAFLAGILLFIPAMILEGANKAKQEKRAATEAAKRAMTVDAERTRLEREQRDYRDTSSIVEEFSGQKARKAQEANQATPGFILSLVAAGIVILAIAQFILTHSH